MNDQVQLQVFGEPKGQPSRALPDGTMDTTTGQLAGVGMGAAATLLFAHLLKGAALWVPRLPSCPHCCIDNLNGLGDLQPVYLSPLDVYLVRGGCKSLGLNKTQSHGSKPCRAPADASRHHGVNSPSLQRLSSIRLACVQG